MEGRAGLWPELGTGGAELKFGHYKVDALLSGRGGKKTAP